MTNITFWGLTASPYQLKMQALADFTEVPWQRFPAQAQTLQAITLFARMKLARSHNARYGAAPICSVLHRLTLTAVCPLI
jgi:hypothetical protein